MTSRSRATSLLRRTTVLPALALLALAVAGCGSSSKSTSTTTESAPAAAETTAATSTPSATTTSGSSSSSGSGSASSSLVIAADPGGQLKFDKSSLEAKAGSVTVDFTNDSPIAHNITIASESGQTVGESPTFTGGSKSLKVSLKAGTYTFYCSVPGHRQGGMEGTLTVK